MTESNDPAQLELPIRPPTLLPEERRIYEGLARIAPAAAQMFLDACSLVSDSRGLYSRQHLVAHLLREIESTLTEMLDADPSRQSESSDQSGEGKKHERIAQTLGLADDEPWLLALKSRGKDQGLHKWAHRRGVDRLRSDDVAFTQLWSTHVDIFATLLDLFDRRAALIQKQIELLTGVDPSSKAAKVLARRVPRDYITLKQLFDRCADSRWVTPLRVAGFFDSAPAAVYDAEQHGYRSPSWPAGEYLTRMAGDQSVAVVVTEILEALPESDNPRTYQCILNTAVALPVELGMRLLPQVLTGVRMRQHLPIETDVAKYGVVLAEQGRLDASYELADALFELQQEEGALARRAASSFGDWAYAQVCKTLGPALIAADPLRAFEFASSRLQEALDLSSIGTRGERDMSEYWRPSLEEPQRENDPKSALVDLTRDASAAVISASLLPIEDMVSDLLVRDSLIFYRLALHLLAAHPELNLELATSLAFEGDLDEERRALNEIAQLQASVFPLASTDAKVRFLECVDEGPGKDLDEWRKRFSAAKETDPTEDDVAEYVAWWKSRRLFPVLEHLEAERRDSYSEMAELLKEPPCWDDYQLYRVRTFSGDRPPVDESVLAGMPLEELAEYLRTWEPPGDDFRGPTIRGMAQQLESVIGKDPARFASGVVHLLDQRQEYVNAAIHGLMQAVRAGQTFDWVPVLGFLHSCTVERRYVLTGAESNEGDETLGASANLLEEGLTSQANSIPDDSLDDVWPILAPVFNDPNPSPEFELKYGGTNMDPFMLSLNTARGKATHALLTLIMQKARVAGELDLPIQDRHGVSRWTELADMLDRCLDPTRESSLAVRAAIGSQLSLLGLIDTHWLEQHLPVLFPVSDQAHREVVFDAYLLWGTIREPLIPLLRDEYRYRTSKLSEQPAVVWERREPQEALVRHVVAMYLHGDIALDDDLVCSVYSQVNQPLWSAATGRAHLGFTGRNEPPKPAEPEYLERAMNLWEWRIQLAEAAVPAGNMGDFRAELEDFGHWVVSGEVDEGWWIDQLDRATALAGRLELDGPVLDAVADVADRHAEKAARVATQLLIHDPYSFLTSAHSEAFMRIVQAAVYSGSPDANREGRDLANRLVGKGLDEFASLAIP